LLIAALAPAQESGDSDVRTRQLWDTTLLNKRPAPGKAAAVKRPPATPSSVKGALIGVTVWRLRPSQPGDAREVRALIHEDTGDAEWTPERVAADTALAEGQKVRISVEAAETGYLYVIDRDEYADGTKGDAWLIFPTRRTRGGDNRVTAGVVVEIPASDDNPPHFKVQRSRPDQINETLTILVSPKPIAGVQIGRERVKLTNDQVASWEKQWQAKSYKLEAPAQEGKAYTIAEKQAGSSGKLLTKDDPAPQTMYRVDCKPSDTVMLQLPLKIGK
jgi:hypothetical protein